MYGKRMTDQTQARVDTGGLLRTRMKGISPHERR